MKKNKLVFIKLDDKVNFTVHYTTVYFSKYKIITSVKMLNVKMSLRAPVYPTDSLISAK